MKNKDMKQNGGEADVEAAKAALDALTNLKGWDYLTGLVKAAYNYPSQFTTDQLDSIKGLISGNPGTAVASAALAGIALSTYLRIRMQGTDKEKNELDRKIREARRESEESSDSNSDNRRRKSNRQRSFTDSSESGSSSSRRRATKSNRGSRRSRGSRVSRGSRRSR